jgi:hypothetical protein
MLQVPDFHHVEVLAKTVHCSFPVGAPSHHQPFHFIAANLFYMQKLEFIVPITFSIKMKIKYFYASIRVHGYCLLKYVSLTAAERSVVQYIYIYMSTCFR